MANGLDTADALPAYPSDPVKKNLTFPPGVVEFKSAWQLVEGDAAADRRADRGLHLDEDDRADPGARPDDAANHRGP